MPHAAPRHLFNERRYARLEALDECRHLRVDGRLLLENLRVRRAHWSRAAAKGVAPRGARTRRLSPSFIRASL